MIDPAALGTLRLGLDANDTDAHPSQRRRAPDPTREQRPRVRVAFAGLLRRAADLLEPRVVGDRRHAA